MGGLLLLGYYLFFIKPPVDPHISFYKVVICIFMAIVITYRLFNMITFISIYNSEYIIVKNFFRFFYKWRQKVNISEIDYINQYSNSGQAFFKSNFVIKLKNGKTISGILLGFGYDKIAEEIPKAGIIYKIIRS